MRELFEALGRQLEKNEDCMLVAIIEGSGSTPRGAGAYMVVGSEGRRYGTVGGGNLEYQAILTAQRLLKEKKGCLREYQLGADKAAELGMVCGGQAKLLFYFVDAREEKEREWVRDGLAAGAEHRPYWLLLPLEDGRAQILSELPAKARRTTIMRDGNAYYAEQFCYDGTVYLFGGGHLAQELTPLLSHLGFRCVVVDDREEFTRPQLFPGAWRVLLADFASLEKTLTVRREDYIAVMTRGHLCDTEVERFALKTEASYIGVVGSRKKAVFVREKLAAEGYTKEQLDRVITPIGLSIGSETPAEIAVSIAAQLIAFRAAKDRT